MAHAPQPDLRRLLGGCALVAIMLAACDDASAGSPDVGEGAAAADAAASTDAARDLPPPWEPEPSTDYDFLVTGISFHVPEGLEESADEAPNPCGLDGFTDNTTYEPLLLDGLEVEGFDLDGVDGGGGGPCAHNDYTSPSGQRGVDYGFLHVMDMIRPARPGQTIETVLLSAPSQGLVRIGIRLRGVDDIDDDPHVEVVITTTAEAPLLGADGEILAGSSVQVDPETTFRSVLSGAIVDGVLEAGPGDITLGKIDLLVIQDRVVALTGARIRAEVSERPTGGLEVRAVMGGWWQRDAMIETISYAITNIGANDGELQCVLDAHSDHSTDGVSCDAMSTMLSVTAVSGFLIGLDDEGGGSDEAAGPPEEEP